MNKLLFLIRRPILIVVLGRNRATTTGAIFQVLKKHFHKATFLILQEVPDKFFVKKAKKVILAHTAIGEIPADKIFFAGEKKDTAMAEKLVKSLPSSAHLVLNFDDAAIEELKYETKATSLTFGLSDKADFCASDIHVRQNGTNFKINFQGNIVPVRLKNLFGKEQVYSALAATSVGLVLGINLVELSQALESYQSLPGRMRLIEGIKNTRILDDSANANPFSMIEALGILAEIPISGRRIAVLGDILGVGKWAMASHQAMGEKAAKSCDLLFTVGARAKFIAQSAMQQGMNQDKVFEFMQVAEAGLVLQKELNDGDLVLVDGSSEMQMSKIVEEVKLIE